MKVFGGLERFWFRGRDARFDWGREIAGDDGRCRDNGSEEFWPLEAGWGSITVVPVWTRGDSALFFSGGDVDPASAGFVSLAMEFSCAAGRGDGSRALAVSYCRRSSSQLSIQ